MELTWNLTIRIPSELLGGADAAGPPAKPSVVLTWSKTPGLDLEDGGSTELFLACLSKRLLINNRSLATLYWWLNKWQSPSYPLWSEHGDFFFFFHYK